MKQTIFYRSGLVWKRETFFSHIRYAEKSKDYKGMWGDKHEVITQAKIAMGKRKNALAGFSCVFAIPNDVEDVSEMAQKVQHIFSTVTGASHVLIYYHDSISITNTKNKHFHVIVPNLDSNNRALRIGKKTLSNLNVELQNMLHDYGYEIRYDEQSIGHVGYRMLRDEQVRHEYMQYLTTKNQAKHEVNKEVQLYDREFAEFERAIQQSTATANRLGKGISESTRRIRAKHHIARERLSENSFRDRPPDRREAESIETVDYTLPAPPRPLPPAPEPIQFIIRRVRPLEKKSGRNPELRRELHNAFRRILQQYTTPSRPIPAEDFRVVPEATKMSKVDVSINISSMLQRLRQHAIATQHTWAMTRIALANHLKTMQATLRTLIEEEKKERQKEQQRENKEEALRAMVEFYMVTKQKGYGMKDFIRKCVEKQIPEPYIEYAISTVDHIPPTEARQLIASITGKQTENIEPQNTDKEREERKTIDTMGMDIGM